MLKCILDRLFIFFLQVPNKQSWGLRCPARTLSYSELRIHKGALVVLGEMDCWKWKQESLDWQRRVWRGKMGNEAKKKREKRERECRKPLATCLQSAICWWQSSWRGGAQHPFLAMRSSLINKTKRVSCVTPICYLHPSSRTPFISV